MISLFMNDLTVEIR